MTWQEWIVTLLRGAATGGYVPKESRKLPDANLPATTPATDDQLLGEKGKAAPEAFKRKIRGQAEQYRQGAATGGMGAALWDTIKTDVASLWPWLIIGVMVIMGLAGVMREAPNVVVQLSRGKKGR